MFTNLPPVTKGLLIANCAVFVLQLLLGPALDAFMLWPWLPPEAAGQGLPDFMPWQLLTHGFMHSTGNPAHLLFNMLALLMFGAPLEYTWGNRRFLAYYLVCVAGAGLCSWWSPPGWRRRAHRWGRRWARPAAFSASCWRTACCSRTSG